MPTIEFVCQQCSSPATADCGESLQGGKLSWYCSYHCEKCGASLELDDLGFPPPEIRKKIVHAYGCWDVILTSTTGNRAQVALALRKILSLDSRYVTELLKKNPCVMFSGTRVEASWVAQEVTKRTNALVELVASQQSTC